MCCLLRTYTLVFQAALCANCRQSSPGYQDPPLFSPFSRLEVVRLQGTPATLPINFCEVKLSQTCWTRNSCHRSLEELRAATALYTAANILYRANALQAARRLAAETLICVSRSLAALSKEDPLGSFSRLERVNVCDRRMCMNELYSCW
ncbi:uncharacterized protein YALI1_D12587g [Yarrowia lipolytica]|uniref:Uncharacterized protein n=1 Tax=Yarrowia lipolytica TaxID=4952 RepID=A0A1D8NDZ0_YARLL|nr:hypothetical protein YALI1_D12587g [Yarrowia lipolytica]